MKGAWIATVACVICVTNPALAVNVKEDRFTGATIITAHEPLPEISGKPFLFFVAHLEHKSMVAMGIQIQVYSNEWQYLKCHDLHWLVDGKPFDMGPADYDGDVVTSGVHETLTLALDSPEKLKILAGAASIEYKICGDEVSLTPQGMDELHAFVTAIENAKK